MKHLLDSIKEYRWQLALPGLVGLVVLGFVVFGRTEPAVEQAELSEVMQLAKVKSDTDQEQMQAVKSEEEVPTHIVVDVKGAVVRSGVYRLEKGARVQDAVAAAGGLTEQADHQSVNLAQKLTDEAMVYVANQGENRSILPAPTSQQGSSGQEQGKVNLNTATESELQTISGIGAKKAADILAYRTANGGFHSVDDLLKVSGIGKKSLEKIRDHVTVD